MGELVAILVPIACGCVLPIMVVWLAIRKWLRPLAQGTPWRSRNDTPLHPL